MTYIVYGAVGVIAVLLLFAAGCLAGWKARVSYEKHNKRVMVQAASDEEVKQFMAAQEAFSAMINYSPDQAYGLNTSVADLARRE